MLPSGTQPSIDGESVSNVSSTDATLEAQIDTGGLETAYRFRLESGCLPPLACLAIVEYPLPSGQLLGSFIGQSVSIDLNSAGVTLHPGNKYQYSVEATNSAGTTRDPDQTFTTPLELPGPVPPAAQNSGGGAPSSSVIQPSLSTLPFHHKKPRHHRRRLKVYRAGRRG